MIHFHKVICTLAIHHFKELERPFQGVFRVMRSGNFVIFTSTPKQMEGYWLNEYFPEAMQKSIKQMPKLDRVTDSLKQAGFGRIETEIYEIRPDLQDRFLYCGKHTPELYLDAEIRVGISTFSNLAIPAEVDRGCIQLAEDIHTGAIHNVIKKHRHGNGDYLFVIAQKE